MRQMINNALRIIMLIGFLVAVTGMVSADTSSEGLDVADDSEKATSGRNRGVKCNEWKY